MINPIMPTGLSAGRSSAVSAVSGQLSLRLGYVIKHIPTTSANSKSKLMNEYDVAYLYSSTGNNTLHVAYNAISMGAIGSENSITGLLTAAPLKYKANGVLDTASFEGSVVILGFLNGFQNNPIILGAVRAEKKGPEDATSHFTFEYNGIVANVNEDGALQITKEDGPSIQFNTDNEIVLESSGQSVTIDSVGSVTIDSDLSVDIDTTDFDVDSTNISLTATSASINAPDVTINQGVDFVLKANPSFVSGFQAANNALALALQALGALGQVMNADPAFNGQYPAEAGAASTMASACQAASSAVQALTATMTPGQAISVTTRTT